MIRARALHPLLAQWMLLLALLAAGVLAALRFDAFWREDLLLYDAGLPRGPAPQDVVIVAIDDASLARIGQWPWPRSVHAELLDRLRAAGARAVALDIILTEPSSDANDDARLAAAMRAGPPTVLPLIADWQRADRAPREVLPIASLAAAAAALAHVHLELDRDGIARSVFLHEGAGQANRPHMALALLEAGGWRGTPPAGQRAPALPPSDAWSRDDQILIPFLGPPGHFRRLSYVDVLHGRIPEGALRGALVLVGATAQGLSDAFPTPRSGEGVAMPGVEISANVLAALRARQVVRPLGAAFGSAASLLPLVLGFLGFLRLSPRASLLTIVGLAAGTLLSSLLLLRMAGLWWPPSAALMALVLAYPLWSWRRLEATQAFLDEELAQFAAEPLPVAAAVRTPLAIHDTLQGRIDRARDATARLRHLRELLAGTIASLPDAALLVDGQGHIGLANAAAATLFGAASGEALSGRSVAELLDPMLEPQGTGFATLSHQAPASVEFRDREGRERMLRISPFRDSHGERAGSVLDIADVTALKSAERERDDLIRFLSHDLRSPSTSLIALSRLLRDPVRQLPREEAAARIESLATRTLALADGFIALARAQFISATRFAPLDLRDALQDALDEVWAAATARRIGFAIRMPEAPAPIVGDRDMLARALVNLLGNAVKFSPEGSSVQVLLSGVPEGWQVRIADQGPGITADRQGKLFERFQRGLSAGDQDPGGAGLGLAFVRVVAGKHGGTVVHEPAEGGGAAFCMRLPAAAG